MLLLLTQMVFFLEIHVFLQLGGRATSGTKRTYLHLENSDNPEVLLKNLTQFAQGNKVLDTTPSKTDGSVSREPCVPSTWMNKAIWRKQIPSQL
jgi:hypothetical protein